MYKRKLKPEEKIAAVESYLNGRESVRSIVERYGVHKETFRAWVRNYETFGKEGLLDKHQKASYSKEVRMAAVKEYLAGGQSQAAICKKYKIYSRRQLHDWIKVYNSHRELRTNSGRGSGIYMTKGRNTTYEERVEIVSYCIANGNDYTATIEKYGVSYQQIYAMEGFWGILKCEMYYLNRFETYEELVSAVEQFIYYYNHKRRQHKLCCLPPATYRSFLEAA
jgi:transposase-like protein